MRNLGADEESLLDRQDVRSFFENQATEAIRRDEIPYEMRELVRRYFLQIGLVDTPSTTQNEEETP